jgi:UDP-N-acetylmuramate dehydrogenase
VRECARGGWSGLECAIGIPGTVGGALFGNAGANGGEVGTSAALIRCVDADAEIRDYTNEEAAFRYRHSGLWGQVVVAGTFPLARADADALNARLRDLLARRKATQPVDKLNAGCIFKNTPVGPAGKLIDQMGGKGLRSGAARVSELHANFIINEGGARASDVLELIATIRVKFRETYGLEVEPEIRVMGEDAPAWAPAQY